MPTVKLKYMIITRALIAVKGYFKKKQTQLFESIFFLQFLAAPGEIAPGSQCPQSLKDP